MSLKINLLLTLLLLICITPNASAYLDPGTGSAIIQIIVAGVLGGAYAIKMYWQRIVRFFKGAPADEELSDDLDNE